MKELIISVVIACAAALDGDMSKLEAHRLDNAIMNLHRVLLTTKIDDKQPIDLDRQFSPIPGGLKIEEWLIKCRKGKGVTRDNFNAICTSPYGITD